MYSDTKNEHVRHVKMVLDALKRKNLKIKAENAGFRYKK